MRIDIKKTKVYTFAELSDDAKENVFNEFRESIDDYFWHNDNAETLKAFEDIFPIKHSDYRYGCQNYINSSIEESAIDYYYSTEILEFTGIRLYKYIVNNYSEYLFKPAYKKSFDGHKKHKRIRNKIADHTKKKYCSYYSGISFDDSCVLTGYCIDDDILKPIYDFLKKPDKTSTLEDILKDCLEEWLSACNRDYEYQFSEEAIIETIDANDYEFTEDGKIYY